MKNNLSVSYAIARKNRKTPSAHSDMDMNHFAKGGMAAAEHDEVPKQFHTKLDDDSLMMKPRMYADGGKIEDQNRMSGKTGMVRLDTESNQNQRGVNQHGYKGNSGGISEAGARMRDYGSQPDMVNGRYAKENAGQVKSIHKDVLHDLRSMKKPNLYAHGGQVDEIDMDMGDMYGEGMLDTELPSDEYSKRGIVNFALGGSVSDDIREKYMSQDQAADDNAIEHENYADELNHDLAGDEMYSEMSALKDVGKASRENMGSMGMSDDESDQHDMVNAIRKKYARR